MHFTLGYIFHQRLNRKHRNLRWLNFSVFFRQVAAKLATFYLPLFLFQLVEEFPLDHWLFVNKTKIQQGMILIAAFYLIERLAMIVSAMPFAKLTRKIGHDRMLIIGLSIFMLDLVGLLFLKKNTQLFVLVAILNGLKVTSYWHSYRTLLERNSYKKDVGKNTSIKRILDNIVGVVTPVLGGMVIAKCGYDYLFYAALIAILISIIGTFNLTIKEELDEVGWGEYLSWVKEKSFLKLMFSQSGMIFNSMVLMLWPLYVFLLIGDVEKVGILYSLSVFLAIVINYFVGSNLDKKRKKNKIPYLISGGVLSILTFLKVGVVQLWNVVAIDSLDRLVGNFHWLVFDAAIMKRGKGSQEFSYFVYRQINHSWAALIFWLLFLVFFFLFPIGWTGVFLLGSVGVLMSLLVNESKE